MPSKMRKLLPVQQEVVLHRSRHDTLSQLTVFPGPKFGFSRRVYICVGQSLSKSIACVGMSERDPCRIRIGHFRGRVYSC